MFWEPRPIEGTTYEVRPLCAADMLRYYEVHEAMSKAERVYWLVARCVFDGDQQLYTEAEWPSAPGPLFAIASELATKVNGLTSDDDQNPLEAAEGN